MLANRHVVAHIETFTTENENLGLTYFLILGDDRRTKPKPPLLAWKLGGVLRRNCRAPRRRSRRKIPPRMGALFRKTREPVIEARNIPAAFTKSLPPRNGSCHRLIEPQYDIILSPNWKCCWKIVAKTNFNCQ